MDTDRLRYFCTIAQTANMHRAAELLHLSPAALSKAVKLLESEVSIKLISPSGRGIVITDAGKDFATRAQILLTQFESLKRSPGAEIAKVTLKLGSFEVFTTHALSYLVAKMEKDADLELHELIPGQLEESLVNKNVDIGITYLPIPKPEIDFLKVATLSMGIYTVSGPLQKMGLNRLPFSVPILPLQGSPTKVVGLDGWPDHLFPRTVKFKVTMMESALELCRKGMAAAFLPRFVVKLHNEKVKEAFQLVEHSSDLPFPQKFSQQPVYIVKRKTTIENAAIKKLASQLRLLCSM